MNIIEIIRAQGAGTLEPEPVVPGESLKVEPGDRIRCEVPFTEVTSAYRRGNDLTLVLAGLTAIHFKEFFSTITKSPQAAISFKDQELSAENLNLLLTITLAVTNAAGMESQLFLLPGSNVSAHSGDVYTVNAQEFAVKDLHRDGENLTLSSHDEEAKILVTLQGFFIAPYAGAEPPQLQLTDPAEGATRDRMIHPRDKVFQWQGEPLPQAVVGAMYAYYFHLDAEDADHFILTAKTAEGELPPWLTFAHVGKGSYLLSGLPTAEAAGTQAISISAQSKAKGVGLHTQQAFHLQIRSSSDWVTRARSNDVAAAEFRKLDDAFAAQTYAAGLLTIEQMPYMTMPEIAAIVGLAAVGQIAFKQPFSSFSTAEEIESAKSLESGSQLADTSILQKSAIVNTQISGGQFFGEPAEVVNVVSPANTESASELQTAGTLTPTTTESGDSTTTTTSTSEEMMRITAGPETTPLVDPQVMMISLGLNTSQSLLPFLTIPVPPPPAFPVFQGVVDLPVYMDGVHGFKVTDTGGYAGQNSTIIQGPDGFGSLLIGNGSDSSPFSQAMLMPGQAFFPANSPFTTAALNMTSFDNDNATSPVNSARNTVISVSDFNGDGINDFLIAPVYGGPAYVVSGSSSGLPSSVSLSSLGYAPGFNTATVIYGSTFTTSAALGDVNGDGFGDVILGRPGYGEAFAVFSKVANYDGFGVALIELAPSAHFGIHITGLGTANVSFNNLAGVHFTGAGVNDIFVGFTDNLTDITSIGVILGSTTPINTTVSISSSGVSGANGFLIIDSTAVAFDYLSNPTNLGNFSGSGLNDIAIASKDTVYVIFGSTSFTAGSTFDVATQLNGTNGFSLTSSAPGEQLITNIAYVGDVNGDRNPDFAFVDNSAYGGLGAVYVIFGSSIPFPANIDYTNLTSDQGFSIQDASGILANAHVGGGGDLNGDGLGDIIITSNGQEFIVFGSNFTDTITHVGTQGNDNIILTTGENVIYAGAGADIIQGGNGPNWIDGGAGADFITGGTSGDTIVYDSSDVSVNGGAGPDILWLKNDNTHADLRGTVVFTGIDAINLTPLQTLTGNTVILDASAVLAMSDANLITIYGNAQDNLIIMAVDNWTPTTPIPGYTTYTSHSGSVINIENDVDVFIQPRMLVDFIDGVHGFSLDSGPIANNNLGWGVTIAPDINGDGFGELLAANRNGYNFMPKAEIVFGQATFPSAHIQVTDAGVVGTEFFTNPSFLGGFVAGTNDFNGDGYNDFLIAPLYSHHAYIVYGDPSGFAPTVDLSTMGSAGLDIFSPAIGFGTGFTTGNSIGDINGDGLGDIALNNGLSGHGYVVLGSLTPPTSLDLTTLDGSNGFNFVTTSWAGNPNTASLTAVDIDGDGFTDIFSWTSTSVYGRYVSAILGHSAPFPASIDTATLAPGTGFHIINSGSVSNYALGKTMANIGDFNDSGLDSIAIHGSGNFAAYSNNINNAALYVIFGDPAFSTSGDFDVTTLNGTNGFGLIAPDQDFTYISGISSAGDFNGDGLADFAFIDTAAFNTGALFVIFGSTDPMPALIDYMHLTPDQGVAFQFSGNYSGFSLGGGNDLNGDGLSDLVIGSPFGAGSTGQAFVVFGGDFSNAITQLGTLNADLITGTTGNDVIVAAQGADTIDALDGNDLINGGSGADIINAGADNDRIIFDANDSAVDGGTGADTLWFKDDGTRADLQGTTVFTGIDVLDLKAMTTLTGNQVSLDAATVNAMSDANELTVNGSPHDVLRLGADNWTTSIIIPGYTTYTSFSGSVVNVEDGVQVEVALAAPVISDATLDGTNGFVMNPPVAYGPLALFGETIVVVHNPLGDGFDTLFVNAPLGGAGYTGQAFLVPGTSTILPASTTIDDPALNSTLVYQGVSGPFFSIADLGGFTGAGNHNLSFVIGGPEALVSLTPITSFVSPQDVNALTLMNISNGPFNSMIVSAIGDMNGDGLTDLGIFSEWVENVYVVFGTTTPPATLDLSTELTGSNGFEVTNPFADFSDITNLISTNINGDGFSDIVYHYVNNTTSQDSVMIVLGQSAAFPATSSNTDLITAGQAFNITDNAHPDSNVYGVTGFGSVMANAGDFNGDGLNDLAIANPLIGTVYLIFGNPSYGAATSFDVSSLNGTNGLALTAPAGYIITAVNFVGDMNGDGHADMAIAAYSLVTFESNIYVQFGSDNPYPATLSMVPTSPDEGLVIHHYGPVGENQIGAITSGDFNGDGLSDIIYSNTVGLYSANPGAVYVIYGSDFSNAITHMGTSSGDLLVSTASADNMVGGAGNDTINALAGDDLINGGSGADIIIAGADNDRIIFDANDFSVDGGTGTDTLWLEQDATHANLITTSTVYTGIDTINLSALQVLSGNSVTLDSLTIQSMSDSNVMTIDGSAQDILHLVATDNWVSGAGAPGYTTYTSLSGSVLNVDSDVRVMFEAPASPVTLSFTLAELTDGDRGFDLTSIIHRPIPPQYAATSAIIVRDGDGFDNLLIANGFVAGDSPFTRAFMIDGQAVFSSPVPFDDPSLTLTTFNNDSFGSPIAAYGQLVASVGDFNGDGVSDIVISEFFGGNAHLVLGGFTSPVVLSTSSIEILGNETNSVAALGDVNGDGLADFMQSNSNNGFGAVIFGDATPGASINMMTLSGTDGFQIARPSPAFTPGVHDITGADFDGDGKNDVFASYYDSGIQTGGIAVILGSTPVFSSTVTITSAGITGADGFLITNSAGIPGSDNYLINPTNIGSFTGSGFDDIALSSKDTVYVIFGSAAFASATSFDVATELDGNTGFTLTSTGPADITSIASVNDVNGDGLSDFAVMDSAANGGLGTIHVIFGSAGPMPASIDMSNLTSDQGFDITDPFGFPSNYTVGGLFGNASVSGGGDLNGDGLGDIVVTSNSHEYVVFGGNFNGAISQLGGVGNDNLYGTAGDDNIVGAQGSDTLTALAGNDFINGGSGNDIINGGIGADRIVYDANDTGIGAVDGGTGTDTLWFKDDSTLADLRGSTIFSGIDEIDLHALSTLTGNLLTLDAVTVNAMSDANQLTVNGSGHDTLQLEGAMGVDWVMSSPIAGYTTWTSALNNAVVHVEDTMQPVNFI